MGASLLISDTTRVGTTVMWRWKKKLWVSTEEIHVLFFSYAPITSPNPPNPACPKLVRAERTFRKVAYCTCSSYFPGSIDLSNTATAAPIPNVSFKGKGPIGGMIKQDSLLKSSSSTVYSPLPVPE